MLLILFDFLREGSKLVEVRFGGIYAEICLFVLKAANFFHFVGFFPD